MMSIVVRPKYDKCLYSMAFGDIITSYLTYGKGGNNVNNGRIHFTGGGSTESASTCRYRETLVAYGGNAWVQDRQSVAHQVDRVERVSRKAQEQESRTRKLTVLSVAPRVSPARIQPVDDTPHRMQPCSYSITRR